MITNSELLIISFFSFSISAISTYLVVPFLIRFSAKSKLIDIPNKRKQHSKPMLMAGGISMVTGYIITVLILIIFSQTFNNEIIKLDPKIIVGIICSIIFFFLGFWDDINSISPFARLFLQILISILVWSFGLRVDSIDLTIISPDLSIYLIPKIVSLIFTCIWISGITNALNWIDGLDGLSSGISLTSSLGLAIFCYAYGNFEIGLFLSIIGGCNLGFLKYNYFPAKILMGDGGSYFLGNSFAIYSLIAISSLSINDQKLSILIPLILISIPLGDMFYVIIKRISKGKTPFYGDRNHLHHRLLRTGLTHKQTVEVILLSNMFISNILFFYTNLLSFKFFIIFTTLLIFLFITRSKNE